MMFYSGRFELFSLLFGIAFLAFFAVFTYILICNVRTWVSNNNSPRITTAARVVEKHSHITHSNGHMHRRFYVTFRLGEGEDAVEEIEFHVFRSVYERLSFGDEVRLTYQGTRFIDVE